MRFYFKYVGILLVSIFWISNIALAQVEISVSLNTALPRKDKPLFVAFDFDNWYPGNPKYELKYVKDNKYSIVLQNAPKYFQYKVTQGSWMFVEGTEAGVAVPNHIFNNSALKQSVEINGWEKIIAYDIILDKIPENTPEDAKIFISGNFNKWEVGSKDYECTKNIAGQYIFRLVTHLPKIEFKFNRGDWRSMESLKSGKLRAKRIFFRKSDIDNKAIMCSIEGWEDMQAIFGIFSFQDLLLLFAVFQGIIFIIVIFLIKAPNNNASNKWLCVLLFLVSISILIHILSSYHQFLVRAPYLAFLHHFIYFLYAPVFYVYLTKLLYGDQKLPHRWYLFFVPFLIQFFVYLPFMLENDKQLIMDLMEDRTTVRRVLEITSFVAFLWNCLFWYIFFNKIKGYESSFQSTLSYEYNLYYLNAALIIQLMVLCFWAFLIALYVYSFNANVEDSLVFEISKDFLWLVFSLITYFLGFNAIYKTDTLKVTQTTSTIIDDILDVQISSTQRYPEDGFLENAKGEIEKIENLMQKNKPYINPRISLADLALQLNLSPHFLSRILNEHYKQNFFDFINSHRVEEFKSMLINPKNNNLTFLGLAYEVGFNSKTAFNRAFKKITNKTPKEYLESIH